MGNWLLRITLVMAVAFIVMWGLQLIYKWPTGIDSLWERYGVF